MIIYNYYFAILILAIFFYLISNKNPSILLAIIIIIIIGYYYFNNIYKYNDELKTNYKNKIKLIENEILELNRPEYDIKPFIKDIKYLDKDNYLVEILLNVRFIKVFD